MVNLIEEIKSKWPEYDIFFPAFVQEMKARNMLNADLMMKHVVDPIMSGADHDKVVLEYVEMMEKRLEQENEG